MSHNIQYSPQFLQKRKMAMVLPIFITPVVCLLFWLFDGGMGVEDKGNEYTSDNINSNIPAPLNVDIEGSKLNAYLHSNSYEKKEEQIKNLLDWNLGGAQINSPDSYISQDNKKDDSKSLDDVPIYHLSSGKTSSSNRTEKINKEEDEFTRQLNALYEDARIKQNDNYHNVFSENSSDHEVDVSAITSTKSISNTISSQTSVSDQSKNFEINNSESVTEKKNSDKATSDIYEVSVKHKKQIGNLVRTALIEIPTQEGPEAVKNQFYTIGRSQNPDEGGNTIGAVIHQDQTLSEGSTVKLRILSDINLNGKIIPKDTFIYGIASFSSERLNISISNIRYKKDILPFSLNVYDQDGLKGIRVPGAKVIGKGGREVLARVVDGVKAPNDLGGQQTGSTIITTNPPSAGQYLVLEGLKAAINVTKSLISGSLRVEKIYIKANYRVYLKK